MDTGHSSAEVILWRDDAIEATSDDVVDRVAWTIRDMHRSAGLQLALDVGRLILEQFYEGDLRRLRFRSRKDMSLRKLAAHPALPFSKSALHQAIAVFELVERLGGPSACGKLGISHLRAVLPAPPDLQSELVERARREGWTVARTEAEARSTRPPTARGRPPLPPFVKTLHALRRYVDEPDQHFAGLETADLDDEEASVLFDIVNALRQQCEDLEARLRPGASGRRRRRPPGNV